ncbi:MAG: T9SS type A sorting domain-containing protein [Chitinophagales bacterium]
MKSCYFLFIFCSFFLFSQGQTHIQFANHTNLAFDFEITSTEGNTEAITQSQTHVIPWESCNHHDLGDQIEAILLGILFNESIKHTEDKYILKLDRNKNGNPADAFKVSVGVSHNSIQLFTILAEQKADGAFIYNLQYGDNALDQAAGYLLVDNTGNDPHVANQVVDINGVDYKIVYGTYNKPNDGTENVIYSISELHPDNERQSTPDASDLEDKTVLNVWTFNPGMLKPLNFNDNEENERTKVFHLGIPDNMDIVFLQEMFELNLADRILDSLSDKYPYYTTRHNSPVIPGLSKEGGVRILSKHPILETADVSFHENGSVPDDIIGAMANKGVKYAKIDKLGQIVHAFGVHTGIRPSDLYIMGKFVSEMHMKKDDIVVMAGDYNVDLYEEIDDAYQLMLDTLNALEPTLVTLTYDAPYRGTYWGITHYQDGKYDNRQFLDYILASHKFKAPLEYYNLTQVARVNNDDKDFWGVFDLGDHNPVYSRMIFPNLSLEATDSLACEEDFLQISSSINFPYDSLVWHFNNERLGQIGESLVIDNFQTNNWGKYTAKAYYHYLPDTSINNTNDTVVLRGEYIAPPLRVLSVDQSVTIAPNPDLCDTTITSVTHYEASKFKLYPNPTSSKLTIESDFHSSKTWIVEMYNSAGEIVFNLETNDLANIKLPTLSNGIYTLSLLDKEGKKYSKLLVIQ